jgi:hypothetical protein
MNRTLLAGIAAFGLTISAASSVKADGFTAWAKCAEACLQKHKIFATASKAKGCYVTAEKRIHCSSDIPRNLPQACNDEANASVAPQRRAMR